MGHWELHKLQKKKKKSRLILLQDIKTTQAVFTLKTIYTHSDKRVTYKKASKKTIVFPVKFVFGQVPAHKILSD